MDSALIRESYSDKLASEITSRFSANAEHTIMDILHIARKVVSEQSDEYCSQHKKTTLISRLRILSCMLEVLDPEELVNASPLYIKAAVRKAAEKALYGSATKLPDIYAFRIHPSYWEDLANNHNIKYRPWLKEDAKDAALAMRPFLKTKHVQHLIDTKQAPTIQPDQNESKTIHYLMHTRHLDIEQISYNQDFCYFTDAGRKAILENFQGSFIPYLHDVGGEKMFHRDGEHIASGPLLFYGLKKLVEQRIASLKVAAHNVQPDNMRMLKVAKALSSFEKTMVTYKNPDMKALQSQFYLMWVLFQQLWYFEKPDQIFGELCDAKKKYAKMHNRVSRPAAHIAVEWYMKDMLYMTLEAHYWLKEEYDLSDRTDRIITLPDCGDPPKDFITQFNERYEYSMKQAANNNDESANADK